MGQDSEKKPKKDNKDNKLEEKERSKRSTRSEDIDYLVLSGQNRKPRKKGESDAENSAPEVKKAKKQNKQEKDLQMEPKEGRKEGERPPEGERSPDNIENGERPPEKETHGHRIKTQDEIGNTQGGAVGGRIDEDDTELNWLTLPGITNDNNVELMVFAPRSTEESEAESDNRSENEPRDADQVQLKLLRGNRKKDRIIQELKVEIKKHKKEKKGLKEANKEIRDRLEAMRKEKENTEKILRERVKEAENKLKESERERERIHQVKEEIKAMKEEAGKKHESTRKKLEESERLNDELISRMTDKKERREPKEPPQRKKAIIIGDSNARRLVQHLDESVNWSMAENAFTIEDLREVNPSEQYDAAFILLGTNNVKNGRDGQREANNLIELAQRIQFADNVILCEIPPIRRRYAIIERRLFNATLRRSGVQILRTPEETERRSTDETLDDDLHLNEAHARILAKELTKAAKTSERRTREQENCEVRVKGKEDDLREVMGREGRNVKETEEEHQVKIYTTRKEPTAIIIRGNSTNARRARDTIAQRVETITSRRRTNSERRDEARNTPCKFYQQNRCQKGNRCRFLHAEIEGRRQEIERRERSRSKSTDRRRVTVTRRNSSTHE